MQYVFPSYLYFTTDRVVFLPPPSSYGHNAGIIRIISDDRTELAAVFLQGLQDSYTVLNSRGNAEDLGHIRPVLEEFRLQGFSILAYDYRGYGMSGGKPSEEHACRDIDAAYGYSVQERHTPPGKIIACGRSLGGARIRRVKCPVLIIHGRQDGIILLWHGEALYRLAPPPRLSLWVDGAGHNNLMAVAWKRYWDMVHEFVRLVRQGHDDWTMQTGASPP